MPKGYFGGSKSGGANCGPGSGAKQGAGHRSSSNPSGKGKMPPRGSLKNLPTGKKGK